MAWVQFLRAQDAQVFLNIVARYEDGEVDSLYNRITNRWVRSDGEPLSAPIWEFSILPEDAGLVERITEDDKIEESHEGMNDYYSSVSVRFPKSDLPTLLERLQGKSVSRKPTWAA